MTVIDLNLAVNAVVLDRKRLNKDDEVPLPLQEDSDGQKGISWMVNRAEEPLTIRDGNTTLTNRDVVKVSS